MYKSLLNENLQMKHRQHSLQAENDHLAHTVATLVHENEVFKRDILARKAKDIHTMTDLSKLMDACLAKIQKAKEKMKKIDSSTCVVCLDQRRSVALLPCKHLFLQKVFTK